MKQRQDKEKKKLSPHDASVEESIMSTLIWNREWIHEVIFMLKPEHFYIHEYGKLFTVIQDMNAEGFITPSISTLQQANINLKLDIRPDVIISLSPSSCYAHIALLKEGIENLIKLWKLRVCIINSMHIIEKAYSLDDPKELSALHEEISLELVSDSVKNTGTTFQKGMSEVLERIANKENEEAGLSSGFSYFDRATMGLKPEDMVVIAARPGVGKSMIAMNIAENVMEADKRVLVFSLEMSTQQLLYRSLSSRSGIPMKALQMRGALKQGEMMNLRKGVTFFKDRDSVIEDTPGITVPWLRSRIRYHSIYKKVDLVIIDYLQLMTAEEKHGMARHNQVGEISTGIKNTAKMFGIPIIAVAQLNRSPEGRKDGAPKLSDLRESGSIEQDADAVMLLWRNDLSGGEGSGNSIVTVDCSIAKSRHGNTGQFKLKANLPCFSMKDID